MLPESLAHCVLSVKSITTKVSRRSFAVEKDVGVYEDVVDSGFKAHTL